MGFLFLFFFNNDFWKAKKKKDLKNKFRQTSYIKEKNQANQNKQAKQRNKKSNVPESMNPVKRFCSLK